LKASTTYKLDPKGIELLQSMPTLFEDNYWGLPGAGDCDCFSIAYAACMNVINIPCKFVLAGREPGQFVHVYCIIFYRGAWYPVDLTNAEFGTERNYKYTLEKNILTI
jgi:transglutaminase-like putative cysteine protease